MAGNARRRMRARQAGAVLPINARRIPSHQPCESCGVRKVRWKAELDVPGRATYSQRLCDTCIRAIDLR